MRLIVTVNVDMPSQDDGLILVQSIGIGWSNLFFILSPKKHDNEKNNCFTDIVIFKMYSTKSILNLALQINVLFYLVLSSAC